MFLMIGKWYVRRFPTERAGNYPASVLRLNRKVRTTRLTLEPYIIHCTHPRSAFGAPTQSRLECSYAKSAGRALPLDSTRGLQRQKGYTACWSIYRNRCLVKRNLPFTALRNRGVRGTPGVQARWGRASPRREEAPPAASGRAKTRGERRATEGIQTTYSLGLMSCRSGSAWGGLHSGRMPPSRCTHCGRPPAASEPR